VNPTSNTTPMFDTLTIRDARPIAFVKRTFQVVVGAYLIIGLTAGYRAFYQVHSLDLNTSERVLRSGSTITTRVVTYARTPVSVRLELIQGSHSEDLSIRGVPDNDWAFLDPRPRHASLTFVLPSAVVARFQAGPAQLRVTAIGRPQLSRLPPPLVRELAIELQP